MISLASAMPRPVISLSSLIAVTESPAATYPFILSISAFGSLVPPMTVYSVPLLYEAVSVYVPAEA